MTKLKTQGLIGWISRGDGRERYELAAQGLEISLTPNSLAREGVPMRWVGGQAIGFGLEGEASAKAAAQVFTHGKAPDGTALRSKCRAVNEQERVTSYSLIFATPKTVSLLLMSESAEVRSGAISAVEKATQAAIEAFEATLTTRRGTDGVRTEQVKGLIGVAATHLTSSAGDPHLHNHVILNASAPGQDGKWRALDSKTYFAMQRVASQVFEETVAIEVSSLLNINPDGWTKTQVGSNTAYEITAFEQLTGQFCKAGRHMRESALDMEMILDGGGWQNHLAVWQRHRKTKSEMTAEELEHGLDEALIKGEDLGQAIRQAWRSQLTQEELALVDSIQARAERVEIEINPQEMTPKVMDQILVEMTARGATILASEVISEVISRGYDLADAQKTASDLLRYWHTTGQLHLTEYADSTPEDIFNAVAHGSSSTKIIRRTIGLHAKFVPAESLKAENRVREIALGLAKEQRRRLIVDIAGLSPEQTTAVGLIAHGMALTAVSGVAGAGKTTLLKPVVKAAKANGMKVLFVTRNAKLAGEMASELDCDARTLAWLTGGGLGEPSKDTLILLDEAGVADQIDAMTALEAAKSEKVQLVMLGDRQQAQAIDHRATWSVIQDEMDSVDQLAELKTSWRCRSWHGEHDLLRSGKSEEKFEVAEAEDRVRSRQADGMASELVAKIEAGEDARVITADNQTAAAISTAVQGLLGIEVDPRSSLRFGQQAGVGDRVRTRHNDYMLGIKNGDTWRVTSVNKAQIVLEHATSGKKTAINHEWSENWLELGYAATADSAQGLTVDRALVFVDGMGRSKLYSAATRGRLAPVYYSAEEDAGQALSRADGRDDIDPTLNGILQLRPARKVSFKGNKEPEQEPTPGRLFESPNWLVAPEPEPEPEHNSGGWMPPEEAETQVEQEQDQELAKREQEKQRIEDEKRVAEQPTDELQRRELARQVRATLASAKQEPKPKPTTSKSEPKRTYKQGFFYKDEEGKWAVDYERRDKSSAYLWKISLQKHLYGEQIDDALNDSKRREVVPGEWYEPPAWVIERVAEEEEYLKAITGTGGDSTQYSGSKGQSKSSGRGYGYGRS